MNFLGHSFIASKVIGKMEADIVIGSQLPDLVPFVPNSVFSFKEIHQGGESFLGFLKKEFPEKQGLALAMMVHSSKYGADKFNSEVVNRLLTGQPRLKEELAREISHCSAVSLEVAAKSRLHNWLWLGFDAYLIRNEEVFISRVKELIKAIDLKAISRLLASGFQKDQNQVLKNLKILFRPLRPAFFSDFKGLSRFWRLYAAGLPEKDQVDETKASELIEEIYEQFGSQFPSFTAEIVTNIKQRMASFL